VEIVRYLRKIDMLVKKVMIAELKQDLER